MDDTTLVIVGVILGACAAGLGFSLGMMIGAARANRAILARMIDTGYGGDVDWPGIASNDEPAP